MTTTPREERENLVAALTAGKPAGEPITSAIGDLIGEDLPTEIYLYVLSNAPVNDADLAVQGYRGPGCEAALAILESRGMIRQDAAGWRVTPPQEALPTLATQLEARATSIRAALPGLVAAYRNTLAPDEAPPGLAGTERLRGTREVAFAYAQCFSDAHAEARGMRVDSTATREATFDSLPGTRDGHLSVAGRPVTIRTVIDTRLVAEFDRDDFAAIQQGPSVHVTLAAGVPFTAAVNDRGMAVLETNVDGVINGLILKDPGVVAAIAASIDLMLRLSSPLRLQHEEVTVISDEERAILGLLAAGVPDTTIARRVGISPRTLDRRVRGLLDRLNATTRFQAGVQAAARGWL